MTPEEHNWLATVHKNLTVLDGRNPIGQIYTRMAMGEDATVPNLVSAHPTLTSLAAQVSALEAALTALSNRDFTDEPAIVQGVLASLTPEKIAAAIPPTLAKQVADELARRLVAEITDPGATTHPLRLRRMRCHWYPDRRPRPPDAWIVIERTADVHSLRRTGNRRAPRRYPRGHRRADLGGRSRRAPVRRRQMPVLSFVPAPVRSFLWPLHAVLTPPLPRPDGVAASPPDGSNGFPAGTVSPCPPARRP